MQTGLFQSSHLGVPAPGKRPCRRTEKMLHIPSASRTDDQDRPISRPACQTKLGASDDAVSRGRPTKAAGASLDALEVLEQDTAAENISSEDAKEGWKSPQVIDGSAFECSWKSVTVRGWPDGSTVFKFDAIDPLTDSESDLGEEPVTWSRALKLGVKFQHQAMTSLAKLDRFVSLYKEGKEIHPRLEMRWSMYKTYRRANKRLAVVRRRGKQFSNNAVQDTNSNGGSHGGDVCGKVGSSVETRSRKQQQQQETAKNRRQRRLEGKMLQKEARNSVGNGNATAIEGSSANHYQNGILQWQATDVSVRTGNAVFSKTNGNVAGTNTALSKRLHDDTHAHELLPTSGNAASKGEEDGVQPSTDRFYVALDHILQADASTKAENDMKSMQDALPAAQGGGDEPESASLSNATLAGVQSVRQVTAIFRFFLHFLWHHSALRCISPSIAALRSALSTLARLPVALYRLLPYGARAVFHGPWPPRVEALHASPTLASILSDREGMNRITLAAAGFDAQGRCSDPLSDLERWHIERLLGCGIRNVSIYRTALTHATAILPENRVISYERLEFLGDAVMELCIRQLLMQRAPEADEGELTSQGQCLVNGANVNKYANWLGLEKWVVRNAYAMRDNLLASPYILGDAFEALLGALYVDRGLESARKFLLRVLNDCPQVDLGELNSQDYKGQLLRIAHSRKTALPSYQVVDVSSQPYGNGGGKRKHWRVEVLFDGESVGMGVGFEKRAAEQEAAKNALMTLSEMELESEPQDSDCSRVV